MSRLKADEVQVEKKLSGKERDELRDRLKGEISEDLARKASKDPEIIDKIPQYLADETAIFALQKEKTD